MIYHAAYRVVIWLGKDRTHVAQETFAFCKQLSGLLQRGQDSLDTVRMWLEDTNCRGPRMWQMLAELASKPWWTRVWIVQELMQARKATIMWGDHYISWDHISTAFIWLRVHQVEGAIKPLAFGRVVRLAFLKVDPSPTSRFLRTVDLVYHQQCSDH